MKHNYNGRGWEKPYPHATGIFTDKMGHEWQVRRIIQAHRTLYMRWDIDGEDIGASFLDSDGSYKHW